MSVSHLRASAVLLGLALALSASPATATPEQEKTATPTAETAQPPQQQATPKRLRLTDLNRFGDGSTGPVRPGDVVTFGLAVLNDSVERSEDFVLTLTLPPELTLLSLRQANFRDEPGDCSGNVCRGTVGPVNTGAERDFDSYEGKARLASSFRGDSTTIRADLQEDANPDPSHRTRSLTVPVGQPAAGQPAAGGTGTSGAGTAATATGTLPRTGDRTAVTALPAIALLLLGVTAQVVGSRRPAAHGG